MLVNNLHLAQLTLSNVGPDTLVKLTARLRPLTPDGKVNFNTLPTNVAIEDLVGKAKTDPRAQQVMTLLQGIFADELSPPVTTPAPKPPVAS